MTGVGVARAGLVVMVAVATAMAAQVARARNGAVVWRDDFSGGHVRPDEWSRCAQPYETRLAQCAATAAGPGEQVYWNPSLLGGGRDPVRRGELRGIEIVAQRLTLAERQMVSTLVASQNPAPHDANALLKAGWSSGWLQTRRSFAVGTTVRARIRTGAGDSSWGGLWMLNDPAHRRWPPEIDIAEVTNTPDGGMYVRQAIHFKDAAGRPQARNCPTTLPKRDWIDVSVTRLPTEIRFGLNGKTCSLPAPPGFDDPMQLIFSQQVGGLAKPTTDATQPMTLEIAWVEVSKAGN